MYPYLFFESVILLKVLMYEVALYAPVVRRTVDYQFDFLYGLYFLLICQFHHLSYHTFYVYYMLLRQ